MPETIIPSSNNAIISADLFAQKALDTHHSGNTTEAIKYAKIALEQNPDSDRSFYILGILYKHQEDNKKAVNCFEKAITINNQNLLYFFNLGIVYKDMGNFEKGLEMQRSALALSSNNIPCLNEVGLLYINLKQLSKAEAALIRAHTLDPQDVATCINLSRVYILKNQIRDAIDFANKAITIDPHRPEALSNIATALLIGNFHEKGIDYLRLSLSNNPSNPSYTHQSLLMNMLYPDSYSPEDIFEEHKTWANTHLIQRATADVHSKKGIYKDKTLKIGLVSSDLKDHSIAYFLSPLLENINQSQFNIYCYSAVKTPDKITEQFKSLSTQWRDISADSDENVAEKIIQDEIDILIDLSGHTLGSSLNIFSHKPAPIQMTYLGYPFSTGLTNIDYRITDNFADPEGHTEHLHTERLARLSPSFLCFQPGPEVPICNKLPVEKNGYITFGSFNNYSKLSISTIKSWAEILKAVPNSKIFLKNTNFIPDLLRDNILSTFEESGVYHDRVILHHSTASKDNHLELYNNIDICLDPYPYNGTTTTFEAIFMGVPVVCLKGNAHYSRVGHSILSNLNLEGLIAESSAQYTSIATNLANDVDSLKAYRHSLRNNLLSSSLTDAKQFTKSFEELLRNAWIKYCDE